MCCFGVIFDSCNHISDGVICFSAGVAKPKKPEGSTSSKDTDSRASTPSKEVSKDERLSTSGLNTSTSLSRSRSNKPAVVTSAVEASNNKDSSKVTIEKDAKDEGPK